MKTSDGFLLFIISALVCAPLGCGESSDDEADAEANTITVGGGGGTPGGKQPGKAQGFYQGPEETATPSAGQTPDINGIACDGVNHAALQPCLGPAGPEGCYGYIPLSPVDQCVFCSSETYPNPANEKWFAYSYHLTLDALQNLQQIQEIAVDSQGCMTFRVEHAAVKALHFSQSSWDNGSASANTASGIPLRVYIVDCDGNLVADQTARLTQSNTVDLYKLVGDCKCTTVYVSFDAAKLNQWVTKVGASLPTDNYIFDVGVETCSFCEN